MIYIAEIVRDGEWIPSRYFQTKRAAKSWERRTKRAGYVTRIRCEATRG